MSAIDALVSAGRALVDAGLSPGSSGNVSVRDGERIFMSGTGASLGALDAESIAVLDLDGTHLLGARPSKEVSLHVAMYARTPEHTAVVHVHSPSAVAMSCLEPWAPHTAVPPLTPYALMRVGQVPLLGFVRPGDASMGDVVTECAFPFRAALLANHGAVIGGADLARAVDNAIEVEEACRIAIITQGAPRRFIDPSHIRAITEQWGTPWSGASAGT